ncbi:glycosyltransferase family 4 protein [Halorussus salinisoli]|uniref:glycosyltransferase family 4 protein n=1 Tax=Halorussus salinisoli TaxID=2558242 RepID=UPI0010C1DC76|nr:glycosyltransferase family 4 protein [Halorussus salinisoli]
MKIAFLSKMFPPRGGGSAIYVFELANALGQRGHQVDVYTQSSTTDVPRDVHDNVTVFDIVSEHRELVTLETLYYNLVARREVDTSEYDVLHGTLMPASTVAFSRTDVPVVVTSHSFAPSEVMAHSAEQPADFLLKYVFHPMNAVMDTVAARMADHVIAISTEMQDQLIERYRLSPEQVTLIHHGVDTDRFCPRTESHPAVSEENLTLLFVGRLITRKGADLALRSVGEMEYDNVELLIAGAGRREPRLRQLAAELGVSDRVRFLGFVPDADLPLLYASADVLLFTSNYEGFGLVFLEAMASGTPVVGPPVGGIPDVVRDGESGYIVPRRATAIAETVTRLIKQPRQLHYLSHGAYREAKQRDWISVARRVEHVYDSVRNGT